MNRRTKIAAVAAALLMTAGAAGSAVASGDGAGGNREAAALTGSAKLYRPAGDDITMSFDAHLAKDAPPWEATGTFRFSHYKDEFAAAAEVKVDCLVTGGKVAVVTGVITHGEGLLAPAVGKRVGISVHDTAKGRDRLGYSWMASNNPLKDEVPKCTSAAPFERTKEGTGDLRVLPWQFEYPTE